MGGPYDAAQNLPLGARCIIMDRAAPMLFGNYNNNYQIFQTPDYVVILIEMIHDVRLIPLKARPHLPGQVHQWLGDSLGRWEGDTLVVDTTNFTDKTNFRGSGEQLRVPLQDRRSRIDRATRQLGPQRFLYSPRRSPTTRSRQISRLHDMSSADSLQTLSRRLRATPLAHSAGACPPAPALVPGAESALSDRASQSPSG